MKCDYCGERVITKICDIVTDVGEIKNQLDYTQKELIQCPHCKRITIR